MTEFKLNEAVSSPQDLQALILEIHEYAKWFSHNSIKKQRHAKHVSEQPPLSTAATATIKAWAAGKPLTRTGLDKLLDTLDDFAGRAPRLTITLAAPATSGLKKTLVGWCRQNVAPDILVNFEYNAALLGGMVVRFGSRVLDWSFRRAVLNNANKFPEVLRNA